jgi:hypothetical protein
MPVPEQINGVAVKLKANIYFDGKVVSHSLLFSDGTKENRWADLSRLVSF